MERILFAGGSALSQVVVEGNRSIFAAQRMQEEALARQLLEIAVQLPDRIDSTDCEDLVMRGFPMVLLWNGKGETIWESALSTPEAVSWHNQAAGFAEAVLNGGNTIHLFGINPDLPLPDVPKGIVVRKGNRVLIAFAPSVERKPQLGLGYLTMKLGAQHGIAYVVLQGPDGIQLASSGVSRMSSFEHDTVLGYVAKNDATIGRFTRFAGEKVYEVLTPFPRLGSLQGVLRVSLSAGEYDATVLALVIPTVAMFAALLLLGIGILYNVHLSRRLRSARFEVEAAQRQVSSLRERVEDLAHLEGLSSLAATVAHDIRNPLNAIGIATQRLQMELSGEPPSGSKLNSIQTMLGTIREQVSRLDSIVGEFLALAAPLALSIEDTDISVFAGRVVETARLYGAERGVTVVLDCPADIGSASIDGERLQKALENLLKNAVEASPDKESVEFAVHRDGDALVFAVKNRGEPIPLERLEMLFKPIPSGKTGGFGLGLFSAYRIVRAFGGEIDVVSSAESGTIFTVRIPISEL